MKINNMLPSVQALEIINSKITIDESIQQQILSLDDYQSAALINSLFGTDYNVYVVSGHPGSGKTTLLRLLSTILSSLEEVALIAVAPYGTAANNMGGKTLGSIFNGIDHYLPKTSNGYIHYKKNEHNRKWIQESNIKRLSKFVKGNATEIKVLLDEFSSFTSEELVAFHQALTLLAKGRKISYVVFGQPIQLMSFDVGKDADKINKASAPWAKARFMSKEDTISPLGSLIKEGPFDTNKTWTVKSIVLKGMHRCGTDADFANCIVRLGNGEKVSNSPEWKALTNTFTTTEPNDSKHTYIIPKRLEKEYNKRALAGKTTVYFNAYIEINGAKGFITKVDYGAKRILINKEWITVNSAVINYLKSTELHPVQKLAIGVPFMSWVNNDRLGITNGTRGLITNLKANEWVEVDGNKWDYVKALDVPTDHKGNPLFVYKALPGHMAAAMSSRKVLGATINCSGGSKVVYHLPKHSESGSVYVCISRVQKAEDLIVYFEGASSLDEMIERFNEAFVINDDAFAYWQTLDTNISEVNIELPTKQTEVEATEPSTVETIKSKTEEQVMTTIDYKKLNEMTPEEYADCKVLNTIQTEPFEVEIVNFEGDTFALAKVTKVEDITSLHVKGEYISDYIILDTTNNDTAEVETEEYDEPELTPVIHYIDELTILTGEDNEHDLIVTSKDKLEGALVVERSNEYAKVFMKSATEISILVYNTKKFVEQYAYNENLVNAIYKGYVKLYYYIPNKTLYSDDKVVITTQMSDVEWHDHYIVVGPPVKYRNILRSQGCDGLDSESFMKVFNMTEHDIAVWINNVVKQVRPMLVELEDSLCYKGLLIFDDEGASTNTVYRELVCALGLNGHNIDERIQDRLLISSKDYSTYGGEIFNRNNVQQNPIFRVSKEEDNVKPSNSTKEVIKEQASVSQSIVTETKVVNNTEELEAARKSAATWQSKYEQEKNRADKLEQELAQLRLALESRNNTIEILKEEVATLKEELASTPEVSQPEVTNNNTSVVDQIISDPESLAKLKVALGLVNDKYTVVESEIVEPTKYTVVEPEIVEPTIEEKINERAQYLKLEDGKFSHPDLNIINDAILTEIYESETAIDLDNPVKYLINYKEIEDIYEEDDGCMHATLIKEDKIVYIVEESFFLTNLHTFLYAAIELKEECDFNTDLIDVYVYTSKNINILENN